MHPWWLGNDWCRQGVGGGISGEYSLRLGQGELGP